MDELAGLVGAAMRAVGAQHQDLGVRNRLADRVGAAIDFGGRQEGRAERLGQAVHQEGLGLRQVGAQLRQRLAWHAPARVGDVAQMLGDGLRPLELRELDPQRRHGGEPGHAFLGQGVEHVARHQVVEQHDPRADVKAGRQLAEAGVERQRQGREDRVVRGVLEVARHALGPRHHVAVREHHALGPPGAAGGVEDRQQVGVDHAVLGAAGVRDERRPGDDFLAGDVACLMLADHDHLPQVRARGEGLGDCVQALGAGHDHADVAVAQDVADLLGLEQRVDRHEHGAGVRGAEGHCDRLEPLVEVERDALAALDAHPDEPGGDAVDEVGQFAVTERCVEVGQRRGVRGSTGGHERQFVEEVCHLLIRHDYVFTQRT